jgi:hypothetical protein
MLEFRHRMQITVVAFKTLLFVFFIHWHAIPDRERQDAIPIIGKMDGDSDARMRCRASRT